jgi:hypothetical protein
MAKLYLPIGSLVLAIMDALLWRMQRSVASCLATQTKQRDFLSGVLCSRVESQSWIPTKVEAISFLELKRFQVLEDLSISFCF